MLKIKKLLYVPEEQKREVLKEFGITLEEFWELRDKVYQFIDQSEHLPKYYDAALVWGAILNNKANLTAAKAFVENYYRVKNMYSDILFDHCIPSSKWFKASTKNTVNVCMTKLTPENYRVQIYKYTDPEGTVENIYSYLISLIMLDEMRGVYDFCSSTVAVIDMKDVTYKTLVRHNMDYVMIIKDIMQSIHLRLHGIHFVHGSGILEKFLTVIRNAFPEKIRHRIHIHHDIESLQKAVPKECLPKDYGGTDKTLDELHDDWINALKELEPQFKKMRSAKSTRKYEFNDSAKQILGIGAEGTFKKLSID